MIPRAIVHVSHWSTSLRYHSLTRSAPKSKLMLGAPYPVNVNARVRSNSSPARPRASTTSSKTSSDNLPPQDSNVHEPIEPKKPTSSRTKVTRGSVSSILSDQQQQQQQHSNPLRVFRLKRPSTASTASGVTPNSQEGSTSPKSPRTKGVRRPATSTGYSPTTHQPQRMSPTQFTRRREPSLSRVTDQAVIQEVSMPPFR